MFFLKSAPSVMETMEIPADTFPGCAYLQLFGNRQMKLENYSRIIDYDEKKLLLQCKTCQIELCGHDLLIREYSGTRLTVAGCIEQITFL